MAQTEPIDAYLGPARTGLAIGATLYQLDGSTVHAAFSTTGWYEAPAGSGAWHHAGLSLPADGGVVAVGISGTEYMRVAVGAAKPLASDYTATRAAKLDNLDVAVGSRGTSTLTTGDIDSRLAAYDAPTKAELDTAQAAVQVDIAALNDLSAAQVQAAAAAALAAYDPPTKAELDNAAAVIIAAQPTAASVVSALMGYVLKSGKDVKTAWLDIWAVIVGDSEADDGLDPATITYSSPDGSVQRIHTLTDTTREQS